MFVYSGNCRLCECGLKTNLKTSIKEEPLRTGDIVVIFTVDENGVLSYFSDSLTVVVSNQYQTYSTGEHKRLKEYPDSIADDAYVMGIKDVVIGDKWQVDRVKKYEDVIDGERWV